MFWLLACCLLSALGAGDEFREKNKEEETGYGQEKGAGKCRRCTFYLLLLSICCNLSWFWVLINFGLERKDGKYWRIPASLFSFHLCWEWEDIQGNHTILCFAEKKEALLIFRCTVHLKSMVRTNKY